jgi:hypothetical protein
VSIAKYWLCKHATMEELLEKKHVAIEELLQVVFSMRSAPKTVYRRPNQSCSQWLVVEISSEAACSYYLPMVASRG